VDQQTLSSPGYQLVWPRGLFAKEAARLLNERFDLSPKQWNDVCELLLADAFVKEHQRRGPLGDFQKIPGPGRSTSEAKSTNLTTQNLFVRDLMREHQHLQEDLQPRRPLFRERAGRVPNGQKLTQSCLASTS
jgi:hypothetical protein